MGRLVQVRHRVPVGLALFSAVALLAFGQPARAGTALNQLCGSAKLGDGCIGAFRSPTPTLPRMTGPRTLPRTVGPRVAPRPRVGGAFGGMGGAIMGMFLEQALSSALDSALDAGADAAQAAAQAQAEAAQREVQALQEAVRQQQRLQEERENRFISALADRPASEIIGGSGDLGILETVRAEAGAPFDGNDPHSTWTTAHDAWFTPEPAAAVQAGSSPVPTGDPAVAANLRPIDCMGKICAFPPGNVRAPIVKTTPTGPGSQPGLSGASSGTPSVVTQWRQAGNRVVWAARREFSDAMENARSPEIPAQVLGSGAVGWGEQALPGMQQKIAAEGRGIYERVMEELIAESFGVISDAVSGRWEAARERSDTIGDRVRESILPEFKMARLVLKGDGRGAGEVAGDQFWEHAKETAKEKGKEALDRLPGPEWVAEGAGHSVDMVDHWLQLIRAK
ncbi:MAG: hypothetical protein ACE147_02660 [Candidatus Methylomirabilales bacterium]